MGGATAHLRLPGRGHPGWFRGAGTGTIRLAVMLLLGLPAPLAAGTNMLVSTLSTFSGSARHLRQSNVDLRVMAMMGLPALVGALLGGLFGGQAPESLLVALVGVFVAWQGVEFIVRWRREPPQLRQPIERGREPFTSGRVVSGMGSGLSIGLLGGTVGLILGSISLPAMVRLLRMDPRVAAGTNLALGFLIGSFGFIGHGVRGELDVPAADGNGSCRNAWQLLWRSLHRTGAVENPCLGHGNVADSGGCITAGGGPNIS